MRYEVERHAGILDAGQQIVQETRHWHEDTGVTTSGREKSDAEDYRYFPEPDLVPVAPTARGSRSCGPRCPSRRLRAVPGCRRSGATPTSRCVTSSARVRVDLIEATVAAGATPHAARKWWLGDLARRANDTGAASTLSESLPCRSPRCRRSWTPSGSTTSWPARCSTGVLAGEGTPEEIVVARGLEVVSDDGALAAAVERAIEANPDVADKIRDGKVAAAGALIGAVMKEMRGQADAGRVRELILEKLA